MRLLVATRSRSSGAGQAEVVDIVGDGSEDSEGGVAVC